MDCTIRGWWVACVRQHIRLVRLMSIVIAIYSKGVCAPDEEVFVSSSCFSIDTTS
ncbi:hypothetical protein RchiOBHm_Chr6g0253451 [Rosa chinensis]|uniref:Uncharacterized protein n=1 Tax=Rosa chinensis TaxID=74649 RepID=A0A2P6PLB6_ROSCH|nr:hypothetical protein RchiOBHm_Chr6g0253451 [Rosa chinensis]